MTKDRDEHEWHWPFPVPDIDEPPQPYMPEQTPYLCCDTRRAFVFAFQAGDANDITGYKSGQYNKVELYNKKKVAIGSLHLHNKQQLEHFPPSESDWARAKEVELVAICWVRGYKQTFDDSLGCYTAPFTSWEVYSVLWVEWIDGIAHRLASGEVDKAAWEELALDNVSLILG
ncbi:heterokaryon incompatibility protein [Colletotrichum asianum]|uniref:Heterokaryon incompatibility protein n=1 Tax=Colletotrichum asianum TaxID=702518 RepID=A0A8H3ZP05_9PEZI|nr:heterokaryon incompatibility protein [Colletotrichum asianum]